MGESHEVDDNRGSDCAWQSWAGHRGGSSPCTPTSARAGGLCSGAAAGVQLVRLYIGINGGYGFGRVNWLDPNTATSGNFNANGGFIGGTLGVNFQASALVFGAEGDVDWSRINGSASNTFCNLSGTCQTGNTWLSTLRGRLGVAADRVLIYGTAGGVFGNVQALANGVTETSTKTGWTVGAGVEVAFDDHWSGKIEYLYANFGNATCTAACGSPALPMTFSLTDNLIRGGINFKF